MSASKAAIWAQISQLLREYEVAQTAAVKAELEKSWDSLRQRLQIVALDSATDEEIQ